eukprot:Tbor_TRINITY_DN5583_c2_g2::TRINITY_DN5583_c2_g2_i14::g.13735::m.13735
MHISQISSLCASENSTPDNKKSESYCVQSDSNKNNNESKKEKEKEKESKKEKEKERRPSSANNIIKQLTIVHFNDVYNLDCKGDPDPRGVVGGAARFHTVLERIRQIDNPLVIFSGDFMGPSLMSVEMKGRQIVDAMNLLGVHYGTYGNHEFDYGKKALRNAVHGYAHGAHVYAGSNTKWVMSNMFEGRGRVVPTGRKIKKKKKKRGNDNNNNDLNNNNNN